jgi:hypothetical protein
MILLNCDRLNCDKAALTNDVAARASGVNESVSAAEAATGRGIARWWNQSRVWARRILGASRRPERRLRVAETVALGERRFVAVVEFEQARFLVGGTSASLSLLARLSNTEDRVDTAACQRIERRKDREDREDKEKSAPRPVEVRL